MPTEQMEGHADAAVVTEIVAVAWETFVGQPLLVEVPPPLLGEPLCASIAIGGPWNATLILSCSRTAAVNGASLLLGLSPDELDDHDVLDILGEFANIVGGNLKGVVSASGDGDWTLSLPVVSCGVQTVPGSVCALLIGFTCEGEPLSCEVREHA
ncbi:MAG: chemotaxis protein CheX [Acidimicrobiia bacterium]